MSQNNNQQITKNDLIEVFDSKFSEYNKKMDVRFAEQDKKMDEKLGNFAEEIILPAVEDIFDRKIDEKLDQKFDEKLGKFRIKERDYLNKQLFKLEGNLRSEIVKQRKTEHKFIKKFVKAAENGNCFKQDDVDDLKSFADELKFQKNPAAV